jgi:hypothetical protein
MTLHCVGKNITHKLSMVGVKEQKLEKKRQQMLHSEEIQSWS